MNHTKLSVTLAASLFLAVGMTSQANAQLTGSTVNVSCYFPNSLSLYDNGGNKVVSAAVEYPAGSFPIYNPAWAINVTDNQIVLNWTDPLPENFTFASFNGFILSVISGPVISGASVNPASGFSPFSLTVDGSNRVLVNYQNVNFSASSSIIDLTFVPEPSAVSLAAILFGFIVGVQRNRR
jgi:hypothetical protein